MFDVSRSQMMEVEGGFWFQPVYGPKGNLIGHIDCTGTFIPLGGGK